MMDLEQLQELICKDMEQEYESANELREQSPALASYREGVADGLHRAMVYLDLLVQENKKAAMPASTAVDPLEVILSCSTSMPRTTDFVKEVVEDG